MFRELYDVARHTPLTLVITPQGERLRVIVTPKPKSASDHPSLSKPIMAEGTPEELDAELPAALLTYTREVNELRATISLPTEAIAADKAKATKKKEAPKAKPPKKTSPAKKKPVTAAPRTPKVPRKPTAQAAPKTTASSEPRHQAGKPGKEQCLADLQAMQAKHGEKLTRRLFIKRSETGRRYEKLWKNWEAFLAEAAGQAQGALELLADGPPPPSAVLHSDQGATPKPTEWPFATDDPESYDVFNESNVLIGSLPEAPRIGQVLELQDVAGKHRVIALEDDRRVVVRPWCLLSNAEPALANADEHAEFISDDRRTRAYMYFLRLEDGWCWATGTRYQLVERPPEFDLKQVPLERLDEAIAAAATTIIAFAHKALEKTTDQEREVLTQLRDWATGYKLRGVIKLQEDSYKAAQRRQPPKAQPMPPVELPPCDLTAYEKQPQES